MTLKEAVQAVEKFGGDKVYSVQDCGDEWYMEFVTDVIRAQEAKKLPFPDSVIHAASCTSSMFVNKATGVIRWAIFEPKDLKKIRDGEFLPLPD